MIFSIAGERKRYETLESIQPHIKTITDNADVIIEINLRDNVFLPVALTPFFKKIFYLPNLRKVTLCRVFSALPRDLMIECFKIIIEGLDPSKLFYLDLSQNAISCDFPDFFKVFLSKLENLKVFKIDNCGLGTTGGKNLASSISKIKNKENLVSIDISTNKLISSGKELGKALSKFSNLEEVYIQYNNIDRESMYEFLKSFEDHSLVKLDLRDNFIDEAGCKLLGEYFVTWDLEDLKMSDCLIGDEGLIAFCNNAKEKSKYNMCQGGFYMNSGIELDLGFNAISEKGLMHLESFVRDVNVSLLRIEGNDFKECKALIDAFLEKGNEIIYKEDDSEEEEKIDVLEEKLANL
ncbi:hypothetical protein GVAV_001104 [Gurleya vavrai]